MLLGCKKNDFINILISLLKTIKQKENHQETLFTETYQTHISFSFKLENLLRTRRVSSFWSLCWNFPPFLKTQPSFTKQRTVLEHRIQTCSLTSDPCVHSQVAHSQYPVSSKRSEKGLKTVLMLQQFFPCYTGHTCFLLHSHSYVYLSLSLPMYFNSGVNRHVLLEKHMINTWYI